MMGIFSTMGARPRNAIFSVDAPGDRFALPNRGSAVLILRGGTGHRPPLMTESRTLILARFVVRVGATVTCEQDSNDYRHRRECNDGKPDQHPLEVTHFRPPTALQISRSGTLQYSVPYGGAFTRVCTVGNRCNHLHHRLVGCASVISLHPDLDDCGRRHCRALGQPRTVPRAHRSNRQPRTRWQRGDRMRRQRSWSR